MSTTIDGIRALVATVQHLNGHKLYGVLTIQLNDVDYDMDGKVITLEVRKNKSQTTPDVSHTTTEGDITITGDSNHQLVFNTAITLTERTYTFKIKADSETIIYGSWETSAA